jgi:predicted DNA-binding protein (MmcQ/YjbR family)
MNTGEIRDFCLAKSGVTEGFPFGQDVLVFKVMNKMFALTGLDGDPPYVNLKCDPERAIELRERSEDIRPGYQMNKVITEL